MRIRKMVKNQAQFGEGGEVIEPKPETKKDEKDEFYLLMSALQKAVRRSQVEKAVYYALRLAEQNAFLTWRRLMIIAAEDVEQPEVISAVETLYRQYNSFKKGEEDGVERLFIATAAKILAEAPKDRRADELLHLYIEKDASPEIKSYFEELGVYSDEVYDMHTKQGRIAGRGLEHWLTDASYCEDKVPAYDKFRREVYEPLLNSLIKKEEK